MTSPRLVDTDTPDPALIAEIGAILRNGGVIAHPSDTVYGLAAAAHHPDAIRRLAAIKGRTPDRPFLCLIDEPGRIERLVHSVQRYAIEYMSTLWPGPLTLIFNARPDAPGRAMDGSIALRCPDQALTKALVRETAGLLASTSANRTMEAPARTGGEAIALFGTGENGLAAVLDSTTPLAASPVSTMVDCRGERPILIRPGAVSVEKLGFLDPPSRNS